MSAQSLAQVGRVELPGFAVVLFRLLPPAAGADHVEPAVAVDVADAQAVRVAARAGDLFAGRARLADRVHLPGLRRILARRETRPFAPGPPCREAALPMIKTRLPLPNRSAYCGVSLQALRQMTVFLPVSRLALRVLVPMARLRPASRSRSGRASHRG